MLYWGLKIEGDIQKILPSHEKPEVADFGNAFIQDAKIVRVDIRVRNCIRTPQADEGNPYFSVSERPDQSGKVSRHLWFGLKSGYEIIGLKLSKDKPDISEFGVHHSNTQAKPEVVRIEIKESGDYGEGNWHLL